MPSCRYTLGEPNCGVNIGAFAVAGSVQANASTMSIPCGLTDPAGRWNNGWVIMDSGVCQGVRRGVRSYQPGVLQLSGPLPWAPAAGDAFTVYPGCDKTFSGTASSCDGGFGNTSRFGGMPYVPVPETAY